jgi:RNA polymerase sigma-70 factor (ECF subfamily)
MKKFGRGKNLWAIGLTLLTLMWNEIPVNAAEANIVGNDSLQQMVSNLEAGYSEYYDILDTEMTLCSSHEVDGNIEKIYLINMLAVLKADSVEEIDYYQGVSAYCDMLTVEASLPNAEANQMRMNMIESEQNNIYEELEEYIGAEQNLIFYVRETYPVNNEAEKEILFENGMDYVSLEEMLPAEHEELIANGYARMENFDSEHAVIVGDASVQQVKSTYSVDDAVEYMITYTSNPSSCNVCGSGCTNKVDTSKYNSDYKHYVTKGSHLDCANYVSQALYAGGIATDSTWKAESDAWINVAKLTSYMTVNNHWKSVSYSEVKKGDIVSFTSYSHVVMITSFDGTTYKYSGHTNDRLDSTISIKKLTASSYDFYRVS